MADEQQIYLASEVAALGALSRRRFCSGEFVFEGAEAKHNRNVIELPNEQFHPEGKTYNGELLREIR